MAIHLTRDCHGFTHKEARFVPYLGDLILSLRFTDYQKEIGDDLFHFGECKIQLNGMQLQIC